MSVPDGFFCFPTGANRDILASILSGATFMDEAAGNPAMLLSAARTGAWHGRETVAQLFRKKTVYVATRKWCACIEPRANKPRRQGRMYSDYITVRLRADRIRVQGPIANGSNGDSPPSTNGENRRKLGETNVPRGTSGSAKSRERE